MRLTALELQDFRGFKALRLPLPEDNLAVLVGVNGAGKSTVLDAIAVILSRFTDLTRQIRRRFSATTIGDADIREGSVVTVLRALVDIEGQEQLWAMEAQRGSLGWRKNFSAEAQQLHGRVLADENVSVPVLCAYPATRGIAREPVRRKQGSHQQETPHHLPPQLYAYEQAFDRGPGPFQEFVRWFRLEEDLENEARARGNVARKSPRLEAVRTSVARFMNELPSGGFSNLRAERMAGNQAGAFHAPEESSLVIDKAGERLALDQLSEGERGTLLLVADIARRLAIANPALPDPLTGSGIVLIDEVDLHLHPQWQRAVLPGLRKAFPNLQFIVSTHSPQVLSRVPNRDVILLKDFEIVGATPPTFGRDANSILEDVMALPARPEESAARIAAVSRLIDDGKLDEARRALAELSSWLGTSDDPEVVRLGTLIDFLTD